jgi:hypothetical protein
MAFLLFKRLRNLINNLSNQNADGKPIIAEKFAFGIILDGILLALIAVQQKKGRRVRPAL